MNEREAQDFVGETFTEVYNEDRFRLFIANLFQNYEIERKNTLSGTYIPEAFMGKILSRKRLAKFTDPDGKEIDVLAVKVKDQRTLENARAMQRNFVARYLNGSMGGKLKDAALVAFYAEASPDWRFSLVRMEYELDEEQQKIKKELTPSRRSSFLVGKNEKTHTARRQLAPLIQSPTETTLDELVNAFNIETVTKEFFQKYTELYDSIKTELEGLVKRNEHVKNQFESRGMKTADFAKRLLGQIVFLYFLQKKGWLGVGKTKNWGSGSKNFLAELYAKEYGEYNNFFNDILEPLFYEALATERTSNNYYSALNCRIPFLNGGLFEPPHSYDWGTVDILLDNAIFKDIFRTFNVFNFTVREDEPLDKEVAIDPEMLGKVFENLIPENERKGSGTYYTPRDIVHYMCRESLITYLHTELHAKLHGEHNESLPTRAHVEEFVYYSDVAQEHEKIASEKAHNNNDYKGTYTHRIPQTIETYARHIDDALARVKICDPAIGSGAFPVGVMNEIVRCRTLLNAYVDRTDNTERSPYAFKRHAIQESIYGVDIESSAVDIAKLRLWLSLVVDEENFTTIQPLPNLNYKIVTGNSLLRVEHNLFNASVLKTLEVLKSQFFNETSPSKKTALKTEIDALLETITDDGLFAFTIFFSEVFGNCAKSEEGFDIVIGNPPYIRQERITEYKPQFRKIYEDTFAGTADMYVYFYEKGLRILNSRGHICYITSNKWMRAKYGEKLRHFLKNSTHIEQIVDFAGRQIFENATVDTNILLCCKSTVHASPHFSYGSHLPAPKRPLYTMPHNDLDAAAYTLQPPNVLALKKKIEAVGTPLKDWDVNINYGIKTGYNEAFIIDTATRNELIAQDPKSAEIIKPILRGRDIQAYEAHWAGLWVIFIPWHFPLHTDKSIQGASEKAEEAFSKKYPDIYNHLLQHKEKLSQRNTAETGIRYEWYAMQRCANTYLSEFEKEKIVYPCIMASRSSFYYDDKKRYATAPANIITGHGLKYLLGILNSSLVYFMFRTFYMGGGISGELKTNNLERLPIPRIPEEAQQPFIALVDKIIAGKQNNTTALEQEINKLVYALYELTDDEIAIVEKATAGAGA